VFRRVAHLVSRFAQSLWPGGPRTTDVAWVASVLTPGEWACWERMQSADRRESVRVARRVQAELGDDQRVLAAALLHDVGKADARLGPVGRALATVAGGIAGHEIAPAWQQRGGVARRFALYLRHDEIGAGILRMAEARPEAVAWSAAHHHPHQWDSLPFSRSVANVLARADGEKLHERD
jgi:hypothetical protein